MTFRWGVIGTGPVSRKFVLGLRRLGGVSVTRVASGRRRNAEAFARAFSIPGVAADAEELAGCTDVDAVYIATPPTLHAAHALPCMAAGKAVLVEKPFAVSSADAEAMAAASAHDGVFCMEGMWTCFLPLLDEVRTRLAAGAIGAVRSFSGSFCAPEEPDAGRNSLPSGRGRRRHAASRDISAFACLPPARPAGCPRGTRHARGNRRRRGERACSAPRERSRLDDQGEPAQRRTQRLPDRGHRGDAPHPRARLSSVPDDPHPRPRPGRRQRGGYPASGLARRGAQGGQACCKGRTSGCRRSRRSSAGDGRRACCGPMPGTAITTRRRRSLRACAPERAGEQDHALLRKPDRWSR